MRGLRHPAAARGGEPSGGRQPLALCAAVRRRARHRSVHARRLRRLPGPVRRRLVHRQGHLRRRCVRARAQGTLSREPDPEPRPARRLLRARRAAERRAAVRGVSVALRRRREPPAPLDPRRLADRALAAAARAGRGGGRTDRNPLSGLSQWKIFDNLRRSLVPPALVVLLFAGWSVVGARHRPGSPALLASLLDIAAQARPRCRCASTSSPPCARPGATSRRRCSRSPACPTRRYFSLDAIVRTAARMLVTRSRLLEWTRVRASADGAAVPARAMWIGPVVAVAAALWLAGTGPSRWRSRRRSCSCGSPRRPSPGG